MRESPQKMWDVSEMVKDVHAMFFLNFGHFCPSGLSQIKHFWHFII